MTSADLAYRSAYRALFFAACALFVGTIAAFIWHGASASRPVFEAPAMVGSLASGTVDGRERGAFISDLASLQYELIAARIANLELSMQLEDARHATAVCEARRIMGEGGN